MGNEHSSGLPDIYRIPRETANRKFELDKRHQKGGKAYPRDPIYGFPSPTAWISQLGSGYTQPNPYRQQTGYGVGGIFRSLARGMKPILKEAGAIGAEVGAGLLQNLVQDLIEGKASKASVKARGRQAQADAGKVASRRVADLITKPRKKTESKKPPHSIVASTKERYPEDPPHVESGQKRKRSESRTRTVKKRKRNPESVRSERRIVKKRTKRGRKGKRKSTGSRTGRKGRRVMRGRRKSESVKKRRRKPRREKKRGGDIFDF